MRKTYIEFIRIIACIAIIVPHIDNWDNPLFFVARILGVPLFAMITGFFLLSKKENYFDLLKGNFKKLLVPTIILVVIISIFDGYINNQTTLYGCIKSFYLPKLIFSLKAALLLKFSSISPATTHLWYLKPYIIFILLYPIIMLFCNNQTRKAIFIRRLVLILLLGVYVINDLCDFNIVHKGIPINSSFIYVYFLIGYELFLYKDKYINKEVTPIVFSIILLLLGTSLKCLYYVYGSRGDSIGNVTIGCLLTSIGTFIILVRVGLLFKDNKVINYIAKQSIYVYFIHMPLVIKAKPFIKSILNHYPKRVIPKILCALIVFALCTCVVIIARLVLIKVKEIFLKKKTTLKRLYFYSSFYV